MKKLLGTVAAVAALTASAGANAAYIQTIDMFTTTQAPVVDTVAGGTNYVISQAGSASDTSILGGYRDLGVNLITKFSNFDQVTAYVDGTIGAYSFNTPSKGTGSGFIRWDGSSLAQTIDPTGLGGINLANPLTSVFALNVLFNDAVFEFVLEAYTSATQWTKISLMSNIHTSAETTYIPLAAFLDCGSSVGGIVTTCGSGGAVDFTNLGALQVILDPTGTSTSIDLSLGRITVVPEPASLALVGLGLLGLGALRRRRS